MINGVKVCQTGGYDPGQVIYCTMEPVQQPPTAIVTNDRPFIPPVMNVAGPSAVPVWSLSLQLRVLPVLFRVPVKMPVTLLLPLSMLRLPVRVLPPSL